jgi:DNA-binding transcriptional MerR regulator/methylmalonyl-CoA mutase cobalamin-binding subunit
MDTVYVRPMTNDTRTQEEGRHPIGVVAERTGLSPEVLRVWERRYEVVDPARAPGGQRLYSDDDVERLRLLRRATQGGRSIGGIARLSMEDLARLVRDDDEARARREPDGAPEAPPPESLAEAVELTRSLDGARLETLLRRAIAVQGVPRFLESVAAPLLRRIGEEWHAGTITPAQEHLATRVVQRVVMGALAELGVTDDAPAFLVAGPAGERHEMGALLAAAAAASEGWRVVYLGTDLPAADIAEAARASGARAVGMSLVFMEDRRRLLAELRDLRERLPLSIPLVIGGRAATSIEGELRQTGAHLVADLDALRATLRGWY